MPDFSTYNIVAGILLLVGAGFLFLSLELPKKQAFATPNHWLPQSLFRAAQLIILFGVGFLAMGFTLLLGTRFKVF